MPISLVSSCLHQFLIVRPPWQQFQQRSMDYLGSWTLSHCFNKNHHVYTTSCLGCVRPHFNLLLDEKFRIFVILAVGFLHRPWNKLHIVMDIVVGSSMSWCKLHPHLYDNPHPIQSLLIFCK